MPKSYAEEFFRKSDRQTIRLLAIIEGHIEKTINEQVRTLFKNHVNEQEELFLTEKHLKDLFKIFRYCIYCDKKKRIYQKRCSHCGRN